jgi:hypothetical protein
MLFIVFEGKIYRPAGCRIPVTGDEYVSRDGRIKVAQKNGERPDGERLIVRELIADDHDQVLRDKERRS